MIQNILGMSTSIKLYNLFFIPTTNNLPNGIAEEIKIPQGADMQDQNRQTPTAEVSDCKPVLLYVLL